MKTWDVQTTVHAKDGKIFTSEPVLLTEKELDGITKEVNQRHVIRIRTTNKAELNMKFFPLSSVHYVEVKAKIHGADDA